MGCTVAGGTAAVGCTAVSCTAAGGTTAVGCTAAGGTPAPPQLRAGKACVLPAAVVGIAGAKIVGSKLVVVSGVEGAAME